MSRSERMVPKITSLAGFFSSKVNTAAGPPLPLTLRVSPTRKPCTVPENPPLATKGDGVNAAPVGCNPSVAVAVVMLVEGWSANSPNGFDRPVTTNLRFAVLAP